MFRGCWYWVVAVVCVNAKCLLGGAGVSWCQSCGLISIQNHLLWDTALSWWQLSGFDMLWFFLYLSINEISIFTNSWTQCAYPNSPGWGRLEVWTCVLAWRSFLKEFLFAKICACMEIVFQGIFIRKNHCSDSFEWPLQSFYLLVRWLN